MIAGTRVLGWGPEFGDEPVGWCRLESGDSTLGSQVELGPQPGELVCGGVDVVPGRKLGQLAVELSQPRGVLFEGGLLPAALPSELVTLLTAGEAAQTSGHLSELLVEGLDTGAVPCQAGGELVVEGGQVPLPLDVRAGQERFELSDPDTQRVRQLGERFLGAGAS